MQLRTDIYSAHPDLRYNITSIRILVFEQMLKSTGYPESDAQHLMKEFSVDRNRVELYPDTVPALESLIEKYPVIALSDGNADLTAIGIRNLFTDCVFAADVGHMKPNQAGFLRSCELAGTEPANTLHIGDHPEYDIGGARDAGLQSMWIRRNNESWVHSFQPDYTIETLHEAVELLC